MPQDASSAASATCRTKLAGWAILGVGHARGVFGGQHARSRIDQPAQLRRTARSQRSTAARNTGSSASSCRPMPHHCGPMPEKTKHRMLLAVRDGALLRLVDTCGWSAPSASACSAAISSAREAALTQARCAMVLAPGGGVPADVAQRGAGQRAVGAERLDEGAAQRAQGVRVARRQRNRPQRAGMGVAGAGRAGAAARSGAAPGWRARWCRRSRTS